MDPSQATRSAGPLLLRARDISVTLGRTPVLKGVNFTADAGEVTAIVGPNGSGKTTLLKAITGEVEALGRVTLNGIATDRLKPWELAAMRGVLPQSSTLAFPFRAVEVVRIGLMRGVSADKGRIAMQALARVGLAKKAGRFYQELSGGEQQRVQLARVLAQIWEPVDEGEQQRVQLARVLAQIWEPVDEDGAPRWLFLDEPVSSLDIAHQLEVMEIAAGFARAGGGVVAVMHDLNLTAIHADSVALMDTGRLVRQGTPAEVLTDRALSAAYGCEIRVGRMPEAGTVFILPHAARLEPGARPAHNPTDPKG